MIEPCMTHATSGMNVSGSGGSSGTKRKLRRCDDVVRPEAASLLFGSAQHDAAPRHRRAPRPRRGGKAVGSSSALPRDAGGDDAEIMRNEAEAEAEAVAVVIWQCDHCKKAAFDNYEDCVAHEKECGIAAASGLSNDEAGGSSDDVDDDVDDDVIVVGNERKPSAGAASAGGSNNRMPGYSSSSLKEGSTIAIMQNNTTTTTTWQCDVCKAMVFHRYEDCAAHEKECAAAAEVVVVPAKSNENGGGREQRERRHPSAAAVVPDLAASPSEKGEQQLADDDAGNDRAVIANDNAGDETPWTSHEDSALRHIMVASYGKPHWPIVVKFALPGRTVEQCRRRLNYYCQSSFGVPRKGRFERGREEGEYGAAEENRHRGANATKRVYSPWTSYEVAELRHIIVLYGKDRWPLFVANHLPGRTVEQCREISNDYQNSLSISKAGILKRSQGKGNPSMSDGVQRQHQSVALDFEAIPSKQGEQVADDSGNNNIAIAGKTPSNHVLNTPDGGKKAPIAHKLVLPETDTRRQPARHFNSPWTSNEDLILQHMVALQGNPHWPMFPPKTVAKLLPGRTVEQCRERLLMLSWTSEEDAQLQGFVSLHGTNRLSLVGQYLPGRTEEQCRQRLKYYQSSTRPEETKHTAEKMANNSASNLMHDEGNKITDKRSNSSKSIVDFYFSVTAARDEESGSPNHKSKHDLNKAPKKGKMMTDRDIVAASNMEASKEMRIASKEAGSRSLPKNVNGKRKKRVWECDVCKVEVFDHYEECVSHEKKCTGATFREGNKPGTTATAKEDNWQHQSAVPYFEAGGVCKKHQKGNICKRHGCTDIVYKNSLCSTHEVLATNANIHTRQVCVLQGCGESAVEGAWSMCINHYNLTMHNLVSKAEKLASTDKDGVPKNVPAQYPPTINCQTNGAQKTCENKGCNNSAVVRGFCYDHAIMVHRRHSTNSIAQVGGLAACRSTATSKSAKIDAFLSSRCGVKMQQQNRENKLKQPK